MKKAIYSHNMTNPINFYRQDIIYKCPLLIIADLKQPVETQEVRFKLEQADYRSLGEQVIADLAKQQVVGWTVDPENEEGIRFKLSAPFGSGWFLLRMSLHEPLLVLQVENDEIGHLPAVLKEIQRFLTAYAQVNQEKLLPLLGE